MIFPSLSALEIVEIRLCYLDTAMAHLTRELEHFATTFQIHLGEGVTECMRRHAHTLQTALLLDLIQHTHHTLRKKRFTGTIEKNRCFIRMFRTTVLVNILPKKFTYFWMQAYLTLFAPL